MAALWRAPATQDLPFQLGLRRCQQRLIAENICAVFLDDLFAIAVAADHKWIAPLRGPANVNVERCAFAVHDFRGSTASHKGLLCPAGRSPGERRSQGRSASEVPFSLDPAARMETPAGTVEVHRDCGQIRGATPSKHGRRPYTIGIGCLKWATGLCR